MPAPVWVLSTKVGAGYVPALHLLDDGTIKGLGGAPDLGAGQLRELSDHLSEMSQLEAALGLTGMRVEHA